MVVMVVKPSHQLVCNTKSVSNSALIGSQYKQLTTSDYPGCVLKCLRENNCKSLNYLKTDRVCGLNSQVKESSPVKYFAAKHDSIYFASIITKTFPVPPQPTTYPKSCRDILASGQSRGTGEYWLDPGNTGSPILAKCDMSTDGGGWTIVKSTVLQSPVPPKMAYIDALKYTEVLSSFNINDKNVRPKSAAIQDVKQVMGFDQIHFYCHKKTIGRVVSIMTKNNTAGLQVVEFFVNDSYNAFPDACGSFDRLPDDTSIVGQKCALWGNKPGTWGATAYSGAHRISVRPFFSGTDYIFGIGHAGLSCDDPIKTPASTGDVFRIAVR